MDRLGFGAIAAACVSLKMPESISVMALMGMILPCLEKQTC